MHTILLPDCFTCSLFIFTPSPLNALLVYGHHHSPDCHKSFLWNCQCSKLLIWSCSLNFSTASSTSSYFPFHPKTTLYQDFIISFHVCCRIPKASLQKLHCTYIACTVKHIIQFYTPSPWYLVQHHTLVLHK